MGIINATPDSFSSREATYSLESLEKTLDEWDSHSVSIIDVGAESTRPGAHAVAPDEEWSRLEPVLRLIHQRYRGRVLRPRLSLDTRHARTASRALELGIDIVNDVSGLHDPEMIEILRQSQVSYILMHNLGVPANPQIHLPQDKDPVKELSGWFSEKIALLESAGVALDRIIIDPGIGFGKTALQSLEILRNLQRLGELPFRLLVGHSRKSFLSPFAANSASDRDLESVGVSIHLVNQGVDILRVHNPVPHIRALRAWNHLNRSDSRL
jgi:dihydropteroate synthase